MDCCPDCYQISEGSCECGTKRCHNEECSRVGKYYHYDQIQNICVQGHNMNCPAYSDDDSVVFGPYSTDDDEEDGGDEEEDDESSS